MSNAAKITITNVRPATFGGVPAPARPTPAPGGPALGQLPRLGPLDQTLLKFDGKRAHLYHPRGDHGDRLAELAAEALLHASGVYTVRNPAKADLIVVGSGSSGDDFKGGFEPIDSFARRFPTKPLVVLPSSFHLHAADVARVFMARIEAAYVYAREAHSIGVLEELRIPWPVSIGLDHDVTFHLANTEYFQQLLALRSEKYVLVVERKDAARKRDAQAGNGKSMLDADPLLPPSASFSETSTPGLSAEAGDAMGRPASPGMVERLRGLARRLSPHRWPAEAPNTPFARGAVDRISAELPALKQLPIYADDIADPKVCSFGRFGPLVAGAAAVVTDRISVAMLATLLDKPTWVRPGTYHKVRGVFRTSLAMRRNVRLI
jgi:hypothetical protein